MTHEKSSRIGVLLRGNCSDNEGIHYWDGIVVLGI